MTRFDTSVAILNGNMKHEAYQAFGLSHGHVEAASRSRDTWTRSHENVITSTLLLKLVRPVRLLSPFDLFVLLKDLFF